MLSAIRARLFQAAYIIGRLTPWRPWSEFWTAVEDVIIWGWDYVR